MISIEDGVAVIRMDDGKANAVGHDLIDGIHTALDRAEAEATAVAILGREGRFSAGFDLSVMSGGQGVACDTRIGAEGTFKIGLNETAIGMALPQFALALAEERLSKRWFVRCTVQAEVLDPAGAVDAGYLDRVVPAADLERAVLHDASRLGQLPTGAYRATKRRTRGEVVDRVLAGLADDMSGLTGPS